MSLPPRSAHHTAWTTFQWLRAPYPYLDAMQERHGETFILRLLGFDLVVFSNPDHVKEVFADGGEDMVAGRFNQTLAPLLGNRSVLMADGKDHRRKRKLLLHPFQGERMQAYGQVMLDESDRTIDALPFLEPFALHGHMQDVTLRVIVRTLFGFEGERQEQMVERTKRVLELGAWPPMLLPFVQKDYGRFSPYGNFLRTVERNDLLLYDEIDRRRRDGSRGNDILSLLLDARDDEGKPMDRSELRDELVTLVVAGHETTATALTWTMRWLLQDPAFFAELRAALLALGPNATPEAIAHCELLDWTAREALRLVPVIPFVGRILTKHHSIGGYELPAGTIVTCSIYLAHRRPEAFPNPDVFDPKRFRGKKATPAEFFPFGGGLRRCIGMAFALYEMKMVLARLVVRTDLVFARPEKPVRMVRRSITITPGEGLPVILERRRARNRAAIPQ